ncbi:restriction endonuclease subunit S [Maridesulfovibrio bastinii]|uniref:restriction endonuclease subunit S n=1 Tax=Maridesulfovibrio bastinii TaxID=47157 RepID=UPI00146FC6F4|nr:restriction endonuclease subunit S [Maridesulfovibrio bastinii]
MPDEWDAALLNKIANVVRGASPRPAGSPKYFNGDFIPWITVGDVTKDNDMHLTSTASMLTEAGSKKTRILPEGTLLLTNSGATLGVAKISLIEAGANDGIAAILSIKRCSKRYLYYFLNSKTEYFRTKVAPGLGQPNLNTDLIGETAIPIPPADEQSKIVEILSTWDRAIEKTEALIEAKERRKKGLMQKLLTGRVRFGAEWEFPKAEEVFKNISVKGFPDEPVLSVTQDQGVVFRDDLERKINMSKSNTHTYKLVESGDFVISLRSFQGGLEYSELRGTVSPAYHVIRSKRPIEDGFYKHYFKSYEFIGRLAVAVIGIRDGKQISYNDFSFMRLPYPPVEQQKEIATILDKADREIKLERARLATLKEQKKGLMQQLLTGKVRVNTKPA